MTMGIDRMIARNRSPPRPTKTESPYVFCEIDVLESGDIPGAEDKLTALVRNSYLGHLKQVLLTNYKQWSVKAFCGKDVLSDVQILNCALLLENKALRSCMLASIYQRSMASMVKSIKRATEQSELYDEFTSLLTADFPLKCSRETQTDDIPVEAICNNASSPPGNVADSEVNNFYGDIKKHIVDSYTKTNNSIEEALTQPITPNRAEEDLLKDLMWSPTEDLTALQSPPNHLNMAIDDLSETVPSASSFDYCENDFNENLKNDLGYSRETLDSRLQNLACLFAIEDPSVSASNRPSVPKTPRFPSKVQRVVKTQSKKKSLPLNWYVEAVAQKCNLNQLLLRRTGIKRMILERRFKDLFGEHIDPVEPLAPEEEAVCRKRVATQVVAHLTDHYVARKIGSRKIFKQLAKAITDHILALSLSPEPDVAEELTEAIFEGGMSINSERQITDLFGDTINDSILL